MHLYCKFTDLSPESATEIDNNNKLMNKFVLMRRLKSELILFKCAHIFMYNLI